MTPACSILVLSLAVGAASPPPGPALVVQTAGDASGDRDLGERLAAAISGRMPQLRVVVAAAAGASEVGPGDLLVILWRRSFEPARPAGSPADARGWEFRLAVHRGGKPVLERELPAGESGPDAAFLDACALVLERFLQEIDWKGRPEALDGKAVAQPPPPLPLPLPPSAPPPPPPTDFYLGLEAVAGTGVDTGPARAGAGLSLVARRGGLLLGLRAHFLAPGAEPIPVEELHIPGSAGEVHHLPAYAAAFAGWCGGDRILYCGGLQAGWRGTFAWATGEDLYSRRLAHSHAFLAGALGLFAVRLPAHFEARAILTGTGFAGGGDFTVEGQEKIVALPHFELALGLGLARRVP